MGEKGEGKPDFLHLKKNKIGALIGLIFKGLRVKIRVKAAKSGK